MHHVSVEICSCVCRSNNNQKIYIFITIISILIFYSLIFSAAFYFYGKTAYKYQFCSYERTFIQINLKALNFCSLLSGVETQFYLNSHWSVADGGNNEQNIIFI